MAYNFTPLKEKIIKVEEWLVKEFLTIRANRATPAILDGISVDSYGSMLPINQVGNVAVEDARTLRIIPWDVSQLQAIEKAVITGGMGVSVSSDEKGVRVSFPELTSERRESLKKVVKDKVEQARVSLRGARDETWSELQKAEKDGDIGKDEMFTNKDAMQKLVDEGTKKLEELADRKEKEISG